MDLIANFQVDVIYTESGNSLNWDVSLQIF